MRYSIAVIAIAAVLLIGCQSNRPLNQTARELRPFVPANWTMSVSNNAIRIASNYEVAFIPRISRPNNHSVEELLAENFGYKARYQITLTFVPLLTEIQYFCLRSKQSPFLYILITGVKPKAVPGVDAKTIFSEASIGYYDNRPPSFYTSDKSIFVDMPLDYYAGTFPSNAMVEAQSMFSGFKTVLKEYPSGLPGSDLPHPEDPWPLSYSTPSTVPPR